MVQLSVLTLKFQRPSDHAMAVRHICPRLRIVAYGLLGSTLQPMVAMGFVHSGLRGVEILVVDRARQPVVGLSTIRPWLRAVRGGIIGRWRGQWLLWAVGGRLVRSCHE